MTLFRSPSKPNYGMDHVLHDAPAQKEAFTEVRLGPSVPLLGGFSIPRCRMAIVLLNAYAECIASRQVVLRIGVSLMRQFAKFAYVLIH